MVTVPIAGGQPADYGRGARREGEHIINSLCGVFVHGLYLSYLLACGPTAWSGDNTPFRPYHLTSGLLAWTDTNFICTLSFNNVTTSSIYGPGN